ncbi:CHC2-type zinc finger protein [Caldicellulosiruptor bescii]|uniref:Zinc finger CHC2-family protein n=3 Tax=Caldicellulosiruptor bescii TaxID=31899 RepID=B9MNE2_CALBD|nr:DUF3854 domain-containing protein [Caldicellulosiruptor bescii]ACM61473.1 conserved hypothetical protein [Caldicellulosiruptor bescii DSM 6725]PBC88714.1 CHC2-type zinc finger protein [Caldicellulosiruptor bescii]PBC91805.1 CHC2-type zinc finger protein [Caldicellulosiruptor bescii]PBD02784.1 CHC2-type zinc finger protein [Caldicellulosiruptor bescii]PBD07600.1 CHC2-type zinc finger protein [Caldicellulosiruptor bescii]
MKELIDITMQDVLDRVRITVLKQRGNELNCLCPYCDEPHRREGHLYINIAKDTFICHKCGRQGNALQLYALLTNQDTKEAYRELVQEIASGSRRLHHIQYKLQHKEIQPRYIAPPEARDKVYREFLKLLTLDETHKSDLLRRGLSETAIKIKGYKSLNVEKERRLLICRVMQEKGLNLAGIPGFYEHKTTGEWDFIPYQGYAIPVRNFKGQIVGLQVRMNEPALSKYRWFSSSNSKDVGTPAEASLHAVGSMEEGIVYVTEGALKADVASYLSGQMFIGLPGVSSCHKQLIETLKQIQPKVVILAFDMDCEEKVEVRLNVEKVKKLLTENGFEFKQITWDRQFKGIDDYLLYLKQTQKRSA